MPAYIIINAIVYWVLFAKKFQNQNSELINYYQTRILRELGSLVIDSRKENTNNFIIQTSTNEHSTWHWIISPLFFIFFINMHLNNTFQNEKKQLFVVPILCSQNIFQKQDYCYWIVTSIFPVLYSKLCSIMLLPSSF